MNIKKLFKNEYLVSVVVMVLNLAVSMVYSVMIARYLGASIKGETAYISSVVGIVSKFLMFGFHQTYAHYRSQDANMKDKYVSNLFVIFGGYSVVAAGACAAFHSNITVVTIILLSLVSAYSGVIAYVYLVENSVKRNILMFFVHILQVLYVGVLFVFTKPNLFWGITNLVFVELVCAIIYTLKLKVKISLRNISLKFILKMFRYGLIPMITVIVSRLNYKMDVIMLEMFPNVSFAQIGVYSIGLMLADKVLLIPDTIKGILLSKLAKGKSADEVAKVMRMCLPICFVMFGGIFLLGEQFINFMYGAEYKGSYEITLITMFGVCALMFFHMVEVFNIVKKKQSVTLTVIVSAIILNFIINSILIPRYGINGAAIATVLSYTYCALGCMFYFSRTEKIRFSDMLIVKREDIKGVRRLFSKDKKNSNEAE